MEEQPQITDNLKENLQQLFRLHEDMDSQLKKLVVSFNNHTHRYKANDWFTSTQEIDQEFRIKTKKEEELIENTAMLATEINQIVANSTGGKYECPCGACIKVQNRNRHEIGKKHCDFLEKKFMEFALK
jgi:hypothetical protein